MKKRSLAGSVGIGVFALAVVAIVVAFFSASWIVSDDRITGAKFDRLGLWTHCFRSLPDPQDEYQRRFYVGCRWIFDPFTTGYDQIRGYLVPWFIIITQFFFTLAFLGVLVSFVLVLLFFLCFGPEQQRFIQLITLIAAIMTGSGISGGLAVIVFVLFANRSNWMLGHSNNFFGWSYALAVAGVIAALVSGTLFFVEAQIQIKKRKYLQDSQARFEVEQETKA